MQHHIHTIHSPPAVYGNVFPFLFPKIFIFNFSWLVLAYILQRHQISRMQLKASRADDDEDYREEHATDDVYFLLVHAK